MRVARVIVRRQDGASVDMSCAYRMIHALVEAGAADLTYGAAETGFEIEFVGESSILRALRRQAEAQGFRLETQCWPMMNAERAQHLQVVPDDLRACGGGVAHNSLILAGGGYCLASVAWPHAASLLSMWTPFS